MHLNRSSMWHVLLCPLALSLMLSLGCDGDGAGKQQPDASDERDAGPDEGDASEPEPDEDADVSEDAGAEPDAATANKGRVRGRVTFADGTAVGQVDVIIGNKRIKSDSRGVFSADDLPEGELEVSVENASTSRAQLKVQTREDRVTQAELFVLPLKKNGIARADEASEVSADGVKLRFPKGGLRVKGTDEMASGAADTHFAVVQDSRDLKAAPGRLKGTKDGNDVDLDCFGMIDVHLSQGERELELAQEAELELPLGPNSFADGQEVDAWSFDVASGKWKSENRAVVDKSQGGNGVAKVKATHFSWWTIAQPVEAQTCLSGRLVTEDAQPLPYLWIQAVAQSYWGSAWAQTDEDGRFCLSVHQNSSQSVSAFGIEAGTYFEWTQDVTTNSGPAACGGSAACTDLGTLSGTSLFDECTGNVNADQNRVLVLSSNSSELDTALITALEGFGVEATLSVNYTAFDGSIDLSPYDAVYLQANYNWSGDMPVAGQRQLINWVNCGGGLVTTEWTTWKIGSGSFQLIDAIFPAARTSAYGSPAMETYTKVTPDPTINGGLPDSFSFTTTSYSGTESNLNPRPGATIFYDSMNLDSGLLGWDYNLGRVASFANTVGTNELADPNYSRLVANTIDWVQRD